MSNKEIEDSNTDTDKSTVSDDSSHSSSRRRLLKKAGVVAPVVLTLANRPAWGGQMLCWSGFQSGNLSGHNHHSCRDGRSPGYYKSNVLVGGGPGWPAGYDHGCSAGEIKSNGAITTVCKERITSSVIGDGSLQGTKFGEVFVAASGDLANATLMQVLWLLPGSFAFHAVATFFNAVHEPNDYVFQPQIVLDIVNDILSSGSYTDSNGQIWSETEMKCVFDASYHYDIDHTDHIEGCLPPS